MGWNSVYTEHLELPEVFKTMLDSGKNAAVCELIHIYGKKLIEDAPDSSHTLRLAMEADALEVIKTLLDYGAGGCYNKKFYRVVHSDARTFKTPVINTSSDEYINCIALAIMAGNRETALKMITESVNISAWEDKDRTLLMWAALKDDVVVAQALLEKGANIKRTNRSRYTALDAAIWRLQRKASVALTSNKGSRFIKKEMVVAADAKDTKVLFNMLKVLAEYKSADSTMIKFLLDKGCVSQQLKLYETKCAPSKIHDLSVFEKIDEIVLAGQKVADAIAVLKGSL